VVGQWIGAASDAAREVCQEATAELLARPAERLVLDFSRLTEACETVVQVWARLISEAQRAGRNVSLVRCSDELYRLLQRQGVQGGVTHAGSLLAATEGLAGDGTGTLEMHLRSSPELLQRLRRVIEAVARQAGAPEVVEFQLSTAVTEAAANAILHGSPEGVRNHVRVAFHVDCGQIIVDVADQGPGFDPAAPVARVPSEMQEHGYGLHMMAQSMDRVEFFRNDRGMLVRLTKCFAPGARSWAQ
jgi:anti-sigma regulatory factor (Ser/Thr protein kinase)